MYWNASLERYRIRPKAELESALMNVSLHTEQMKQRSKYKPPLTLFQRSLKIPENFLAMLEKIFQRELFVAFVVRFRGRDRSCNARTTTVYLCHES